MHKNEIRYYRQNELNIQPNRKQKMKIDLLKAPLKL